MKISSEEWSKMSRAEQRDKLVMDIENAVSLGIHSNVCYLLNFCNLPKEMATELCSHYNAITEILYEWQKKEKEDEHKRDKK